MLKLYTLITKVEKNHHKGNNGNIKTNMETDLAQGISQFFEKLKGT